MLVKITKVCDPDIESVTEETIGSKNPNHNAALVPAIEVYSTEESTQIPTASAQKETEKNVHDDSANTAWRELLPETPSGGLNGRSR